ncbi:MAG: hypothetical protein HZA10_05590 [Nitrospirae bacterium]|nr:hypothetical protein [Nitrospirota bacterium]
MKYSFFKICSLFTVYCLLFTALGCAPKVAPLAPYKDLDLTLDEIISKAKGDVHTLKIISGINIEKDDNPYMYVDAAVTLKNSGWMHVRLYTFGMLAGDYIVKDGVINNASGKASNKSDSKLFQNMKEFSKAMQRSIFWWNGLTNSDCKNSVSGCKENTVMSKNEMEYVINTADREIHLDRATLLPLSQDIRAGGKKIHINYAEPQKEGDFHYSSSLKIEAGSYSFLMKVTKLIINPPAEE